MADIIKSRVEDVAQNLLLSELDRINAEYNSYKSTEQNTDTDYNQKAMDELVKQVNETLRLDTTNYLKFILTFSSTALGVFFTLVLSLLKNEFKILDNVKNLKIFIITDSIIFLSVISLIFIYPLFSHHANDKIINNTQYALDNNIDDPNSLTNIPNICCRIIKYLIFFGVIFGSSLMVYIYINLILSYFAD